jgi:hypothetical protein
MSYRLVRIVGDFALFRHHLYNFEWLQLVRHFSRQGAPYQVEEKDSKLSDAVHVIAAPEAPCCLLFVTPYGPYATRSIIYVFIMYACT